MNGSAKVLPRLRAIREELNEALSGKSFAEQQAYIRKGLRSRERAPRARSSRRGRPG